MDGDVAVDDGFVPPFQKKYFSIETMARYEPLVNAIVSVEDADGADDEVWREFDRHWESFMNFSWCGNWSETKFDVIFYGVTGYSGYLLMEYLKRFTLKQPQSEGLSFAFAAPTASRAAEMRDRVFQGTAHSAAPLITASFEDVVSVIDLVKSAKVIVNAAGPYMLTQGEVLVDACIWCKTDYVDLSQELPWSLRTKDLHSYAVEAGVMCVTGAASNAYTDLGVYLLAKRLREKFGEATRQAVTYCQSGGGSRAGLSREMIQTRSVVKEASRAVQDEMKNPYALGGFIPDMDRNGVKVVGVQMGTGVVTPNVRKEDSDITLAEISEDSRLLVWRAPYQDAKLDARVVRRSNMLQADLANEPYGTAFNFTEYVKLPPQEIASAKSLAQQGLLVNETFAMSGKLQSIEKEELQEMGLVFEADQGVAGPTVDSMEQWNAFFLAAWSSAGNEARCSFVTNDGYFECARMAVEMSMAMLYDRASLPSRGGVLTPSAAGGKVLVDRLVRSGVLFNAETWAERITRPAIPPP
mmetsp:Transcript_34186/g.77989  ORF Transcript_34186/g.77989 Transcript_34186/m.77989 type:complete len:525 (+) Transcript_34186:76-1650(+)